MLYFVVWVILFVVGCWFCFNVTLDVASRKFGGDLQFLWRNILLAIAVTAAWAALLIFGFPPL